MIADRDTNPLRDVYYLGAKLVQVISKGEEDSFEFFDLYESLAEKERISINLYALTLDWLFIIGVVERTDEGNIRKCF